MAKKVSYSHTRKHTYVEYLYSHFLETLIDLFYCFINKLQVIFYKITLNIYLVLNKSFKTNIKHCEMDCIKIFILYPQQLTCK